MTIGSGQRLAEVDALRGVAALAVVLFHYTTRYTQLFETPDAPTLAVPYGHYGVNLFFIISGFVIFMTLDRTQRGMDFVVSRFSRLFPAYWISIVITFTIVSLCGLPGKEVSASQALGNTIMLHGFFHVPHVDGVYWTLEVELLFYAGMFALAMSGRLQRLHWAIWALLLLRWVYDVAARYFGTDLSWTLSRVLILPYLPWFALGISVYQATRARRFSGEVLITVATALCCLAWVDGLPIALLAGVLASFVWAAASGHARWLGHPLLVFFGTISYPLYLLHENIGWVVQRAVQQHGGSFDLSIAVALAVAVALATLVSYGVEQPAMRAIRRWYRQRAIPAA